MMVLEFRRIRQPLLQCCIIGGLLLSGCRCVDWTAAAEDPVRAPNPPVMVHTCAPHETEYAPAVSAVGTLITLHSFEISSPVEGVLCAGEICTGEAVQKGQIVFRLSTDELELQHELLESQLCRSKNELRQARHFKREELLQAERLFNRIERIDTKLTTAAELCEHAGTQYRNARELHSAGGISADALEEYRLALRQRQAALEDLRRQRSSAEIGLRPGDLTSQRSSAPSAEYAGSPLSTERRRAYLQAVAARADLRIESAESRMEELLLKISRNESLQAAATVRAPVSGFAAGTIPTKGAYIRRGDSLLTIVQTRPLFVQAEISSADRGTIRCGQAIEITLPQLHRSLEGRVHQISPTIDPRSGCFEIIGRLESPPQQLVPGSQATLEIKTAAPRRALSLPSEALAPSPADPGVTQSAVYTVLDGRSYLREVEILTSTGDAVLVLGGISPEAAVVLAPPSDLREGAKVEVLHRENTEEVGYVP